jgi:pimeloyl-ACP methyl ester carboxylesterase
VGRPGSSRRRWTIAAAGCGLVLLALVCGCSMLTAFKPSIDTPEMRSDGLESRFVESPEGRLHVVLAGLREPSSPRVLFVHGSPGTWEAWRVFLDDPELRARARLLAPDRPGYGGSRRGHTEASLVRQAAALAAVLEAEPGPPAIVVGHSLGGPIAARLAMDRPDLVAGMVLIAPSIDPGLERHRWYNVAGSMQMVQWFLPIDWIVSNRELWPLHRELTAMLPLWPRIRVPVILIQGEADELVPPANADFAERVLAGHDLEVERFPGENHFILWKQPAIVERAILELLDRGSS